MINDNDFGVAGITINRTAPSPATPAGRSRSRSGSSTSATNGLDASDRDRDNTAHASTSANWPVLGHVPCPTRSPRSRSAARRTWSPPTRATPATYARLAPKEARVNEDARGSLDLDPTAFPNAAVLKNNANLGRLNVTSTLGDTDGDGDFDQLYAFGARSFSICDADGQLVFDSGDDLERITAAALPGSTSTPATATTRFDNRSDNKGPEPEGVASAMVGGRTYAFIGLERIGGVMVYDVTDPAAPDVRPVRQQPRLQRRHLGRSRRPRPGGPALHRRADSPTRRPLLVVANEVSGTTTIYEIGKEDNTRGRTIDDCSAARRRKRQSLADFHLHGFEGRTVGVRPSFF